MITLNNYLDVELNDDNRHEFEELVAKNVTKIHWMSVSIHLTLTEEFIEKYKHQVYWEMISCCQQLSEEFIEKFEEYVDWLDITQHQQLSEEFIDKFADRVSWIYVARNQIISEKFIRKHIARFTGTTGQFLFSNQHVVEDLIEEIVNHLENQKYDFWYVIFAYQNLSDEFYLKHLDKFYSSLLE